MTAARTVTAALSIPLLVLLVPLVFAEGGQEQAEYRYELGATLDGHAEGSLVAGAMFAAEGNAGVIQVLAEGGRWTHFTTEFNYTILRPDHQNPAGWELRRTQWNESHELPPGPLTISWPSDGNLRIFGSPGPIGDGHFTFNVAFDTQGLRIEPLLQRIPGLYYLQGDTNPAYELNGLDVISVYGGVAGWNRFVDVKTGDLRIDGDLSLYLEEAVVETTDGSFVLPPYFEHVMDTPHNPVALYRVYRVHHAFLEVPNAILTVPATIGKVLAQDLEARAEGTLLASQATGEVILGDQKLPFQGRELTLVGAFDWSEAPSTDDQNEPAVVEANQRGTFRAVGFDFEAAAARPQGVSLAKVGLWAALLAAVAGALWKWVLVPFFSRFRGEDLDDDPNRQRLLETIRREPGLSMRNLASSLGMKEGRARYHLEYLEAQNLLASRKTGHERRFWPGGHPLTKRQDVVLQFDDPLRIIRRETGPGRMLLRDVVVRLRAEASLSQSAAFKAVERAVRLGIVRKERTGQGVWLACEPQS